MASTDEHKGPDCGPQDRSWALERSQAWPASANSRVWSAGEVERYIVDTPRRSGWEVPGHDVGPRARFDFVASCSAPDAASECCVLDHTVG